MQGIILLFCVCVCVCTLVFLNDETCIVRNTCIYQNNTKGLFEWLEKKGLIKGAYITFKKISLKNVSIFLEFKNLIATHFRFLY